MPASIVIELHAQNTGTLLNSNGLILHAAWFKGWAALDERQAAALHQNQEQIKPFTISPLMNLPADPFGVCHFKAGQKAWFRITALSDELTEHLNERIFTHQNPPIIQMANSRWLVEEIYTRTNEHLWAGHISYDSLLQVIQTSQPANQWTLEFATPMAINGNRFVYPFPAPESLVRSWLKKWLAFAPSELPADLPDLAREFLCIHHYQLHTELVRMRGQKWPGCVGQITFKDLGLPPEMRQSLDVLMQFSFFCGSGYKTTQGMGQTRLIKKE